jgi:hypothetical protein
MNPRRRDSSGRIAAWLLIAGLIAALAFASVGVGAAKPKPDKKPHRHRVDLTGATKKVRGTLPGPITDRGTVDGKPFRDGRIKLVVTLNFADSTATGTFRIRDDKGTAFGTVDMDFVLDVPGNSITFTGTADFTGGKGRFKGIKGTDLKAYDHNTLDGQNGAIQLKGFATY